MTEQQSSEGIGAPDEEFSAAELGSLLRETRSSLQRDLRDVASELRIRLVYLQAIEDGQLENLPGPAYASGFLRAYGDYLGLDGDDLVTKFRAAGGVGGGRTDLQLPSPVEEGRLPAGSIMLLAAVLAAGAYGGWYYLSSQGRDPIEFVASVPDKFASLLGGDENAAESNSSSDIPAAAAVMPKRSDENPPEGGQAEPATESPGVAETASDEVPTPTVDPEPAVTAASEPVAKAQPAPVQTVSKEAPAAVEPEPAPVPAVPKKPRPAAASEPAPVRTVSKEPPPAPVKKKPVPVENKPSREQHFAAKPAQSEISAAAEEAPRQATPRQTTVTIAKIPAPPVAVAEPTVPKPPKRNVAAPAPNSVPVGQEESFGQALARVPPRTVFVAPAQESTARATDEPGRHQIVLRVKADSWVEVRLGDERPLLSRVMRAGEVYEVPARAGLKMATGNAGGIEILVDGKSVRGLGPVGAVRRDVALDAKSLLGGGTETR